MPWLLTSPGHHISSHNIDYIEYVGPSLTWGRILSTCVKSMWRNDIKCKYMFMLPVKNLACKGLKTRHVLSSCLQPIISHKRHVRKSLLTDMDFNIAYLSNPGPKAAFIGSGLTVQHYIKRIHSKHNVVWLPIVAWWYEDIDLGQHLLRSWLTACCLLAPSHYLNQYQCFPLLTIGVRW